MLQSNTTYLQALIDAGDDAHKNLYIAEFVPNSASPLASDAEAIGEMLKVRCTGFTVPTISQDSYPVKYITATIERPRAKVNHERSFTLTFRLDANYKLYKALLKQQNVTFNATKHYTTNALLELKEADMLFDVKVSAISEGEISTTPSASEMFFFSSCWISKIDTVSFDSGSSDAATIQVTINYLKATDAFEKSTN